jgi:hypothetical protein
MQLRVVDTIPSPVTLCDHSQDLKAIKKEMGKISKAKLPFVREEVRVLGAGYSWSPGLKGLPGIGSVHLTRTEGSCEAVARGGIGSSRLSVTEAVLSDKHSWLPGQVQWLSVVLHRLSSLAHALTAWSQCVGQYSDCG